PKPQPPARTPRKEQDKSAALSSWRNSSSFSGRGRRFCEETQPHLPALPLQALRPANQYLVSWQCGGGLQLCFATRMEGTISQSAVRNYFLAALVTGGCGGTGAGATYTTSPGRV